MSFQLCTEKLYPAGQAYEKDRNEKQHRCHSQNVSSRYSCHFITSPVSLSGVILLVIDSKAQATKLGEVNLSAYIRAQYHRRINK